MDAVPSPVSTSLAPPPNKKARLNPVCFFKETDPWGELSNFWPTSPKAIVWQGKEYATAEHLYHAMVRESLAMWRYAEVIRTAKTPHEARMLGRPDMNPRITTWQCNLWNITIQHHGGNYSQSVLCKAPLLNFMYDAVLAKFAQNDHCQRVLLSTGNRPLCEVSPYNWFWGGTGGTVSGMADHNILGQMLVYIRDMIRDRLQLRIWPLNRRKTTATMIITEWNIHMGKAKHICRSLTRVRNKKEIWQYSSKDHSDDGDVYKWPTNLAILAARRVVQTMPITNALSACPAELRWLLQGFHKIARGTSSLAFVDLRLDTRSPTIAVPHHSSEGCKGYFGYPLRFTIRPRPGVTLENGALKISWNEL